MDRKTKTSIIAGLYGNALEWYDFLLYASFAPIFAVIFFPAHIDYISLLATYSVFALGFFVRPLGGFLFGHLGDMAGRRIALIFSVIIMTMATLCIALLPNYQHIGIIAPILFTLLRMIQGLAVGGELPASATFLIEHMFAHRRGFAGSLVLSTAFLGIFLGSLTASLITINSTPDFLYNWSWRLAYAIGGLLGIIGIYLRIKSHEPVQFLKAEHAHHLPAKLVFTQYKFSLFLAITFTSILALGNYILIAYITTFLVKIERMNFHDALLINFIALFILTLLIPLMGFLSDYVGRRPIFLIGLIGLLLLIFPIFWGLTSGNWTTILLSEIALGITLAPVNAIIPTIIAEMFPTSVRASGSSIGYNIGQAIFGGTAPAIAITLIEVTQNKMSPAWYVFSLTFIVTFIAFQFLIETKKMA